ncbi:hypothetical protein GJ496_009467 [Pomphorhynchus laevis]|nr:hypothetical protein GJ496_009467 [Pomphorhynchus laevis]
MIIFSRPFVSGSLLKLLQKYSHTKTMPIYHSRFHSTHFRDILHFYLMVTSLPVACLITYVNIRHGCAELSEIPEGYEPEEYEYYQHPISRFLAKYLCISPPQLHEMYLHKRYLNYQETQMRLLEHKVRNLMKERQDYKAWYYNPVPSIESRKYVDRVDELESSSGYPLKWRHSS